MASLEEIIQQSAGGKPSGSPVLKDPLKADQPGLLKNIILGVGTNREQESSKELMTPIDVQRTMDADTLEAGGKGVYSSFRFAGIDAPESSQGKLGPLAHAYLDSMLANSKKVSYGKDKVDSHGRRVAMIYADGKNLNLELVKRGLVDTYDRYNQELSAPLQVAFKDAREKAKKAKLGIWADASGYESPEEFRMRQTALYGRSAGARGHDDRPRADGSPLDLQDIIRATWGDKPQKGQAQEGRPGLDERYPVYGMNKYQKADGFLDSAIGALDYAGNVSRSALTGLMGPAGDGRRALAYGVQAAKKDRYTDPTELKDIITGTRERFGKDDGVFQTGDAFDFAGDLIVDIVSDPLTYMSAGASRLVRGAGKLAQGARDLKLGLLTPGALTYQKAETGFRAGLGAMYGFGAADSDSSLAAHIAATATGAAVGAGSGSALRKLGDVSRTKFDDAANWYATKSRGSKFGDYSVQRMIAIRSFDKMRNIAEWIRQGRLKALEGLSPQDRLQATQIMQALKTETIVRRNALEDTIKAPKGSDEWNVRFNELTNQVNREVEDIVLPKILQVHDAKMSGAIKSWADHNDRVVKKMNTMIHGGHEPLSGKGIVGLRFHVDDVYAKKDFTAAQDAFIASQVKQAKKETRSPTAQHIGPDLSYGVYSENVSKNFLNEVEQRAVKLMSDYKDAPVISKLASKIEPVLGKLDKLTNFAKANMLYFSTSWLKNNYFDNLAKSYVESGIGGLLDAGTMGRFQKGVFRDVDNLYSGKFDVAYKSEYFDDALNYGVLDNPMFKHMTDEITGHLMYTPDKLAKADDKTILGYIKKAPELWMSKNPVVALMSRVGSHMEGTARMMTYVRTYESLKKSKAMKGVEDRALKQMAADVVKKTFFDYGDVTKFEQAVFKRIIPFYSFYSKNLPYWANATFDPVRAGRIVQLDKIRTNIGSTPTEHDRSGMTPYIQDNAPRKLGKNDKGETIYTIVPSSSHHEALEMLNPLDWPKSFVEKSATIPKAILEVAFGKDFFSGDSLYPSDQQGGKKFLYSRGFKWYAIKRAAEASGFDSDSIFQRVAGLSGVDVDSNGNPYTAKGWTVVLDKIGSTFLPHGFVDTVAGSIGKGAYNKATVDEILGNILLPVQKVKVSESFARMVRERKRKEKEDGQD